MSVTDLITFVARALVQNPAAVEAEEVNSDRDRVIRLKVDPADLGRIIGKEGRTAQALRVVLSVATHRDGKKAKLDIVD